MLADGAEKALDSYPLRVARGVGLLLSTARSAEPNWRLGG